jgi:hypothetical protein
LRLILTGNVAASCVDSLCLSEVRVDFGPCDNFFFVSLKMNITPMELAKIVASLCIH